MENLAKYLRTKTQARSKYNHTVKELLDEWVHLKIKAAFVDEGVIKGRHNLFRPVRKVTFVFSDYPAKYESVKQEIVIWEAPSFSKPFPVYEQVPYLNAQALNMLIGTYIGSCFITQIVDWKEDGNLHVYLALPIK